MSFLEEDDAYETLQVALAFIDTCKGDDSASSSSSSFSSSSSSLSAYPRSSRNTSRKSSFTSESETIGHGTKLDSSSTQQQQKQQDLDFEAARRERAMKSHAETVKRSRAKKKSEAIFLREQAARLEEKLKQLQLARRIENSSLQVYLQRMRSGKSEAQTAGDNSQSAKEKELDLLVAIVLPRAPVSLWQELAAVQAHKRLQSQALNAELKAAVSKQVKVVESLQAMLLSTNGNQNDFVRDQQQQQHQQFLYINASNQGLGIMADLQRRAHREFLEMDAIFRHSSWTEIADSVMFSSQSEFIPEGGGGPVMELRMNASLHCNFRDAIDAVWRRATTAGMLIDTPSRSLKIQHLTKTSYQKNYTIRIEGPNNSIIKLEGIAHVQRFMGVDHDAYIWSCAVFLCSDKSEVFREKGWVVASNYPAAGGNSDSAAATLCRGFAQVSCDNPGYEDKAEGGGEDHEVGTNWSSDARFRRMFILKSLAHHTRGYHESTQNLLLSEFSGHQMR